MWKIVKHCETSLLGVSFASLAVSRRMIYRQLRIHFDQLHTSHSCNVHEKHHLKTRRVCIDSIECRSLQTTRPLKHVKKVHLNCLKLYLLTSYTSYTLLRMFHVLHKHELCCAKSCKLCASKKVQKSVPMLWKRPRNQPNMLNFVCPSSPRWIHVMILSPSVALQALYKLPQCLELDHKT